MNESRARSRNKSLIKVDELVNILRKLILV